MLTIQGVTYIHPNGDLLFAGLDLTLNSHAKIALIGNNGTGKSTLLKILTGQLHPSSGLVNADSKPYYVPQIFGQYDGHTIAKALQVDQQLTALQSILNGDVSEENMASLNDDWAIEERCQTALPSWKLEGLNLNNKMNTLSGGQKTKVFLAGILIHKPAIVLLDEPTNHLDSQGRAILYEYIRTTKNTLIVVSHDKALLNLIPIICELETSGISTYGGNYDFYASQKRLVDSALYHDIQSKERAIRRAKEVERVAVERQQKLDSRGKKKQEKSGLPTISMNTLKNKAEHSTSKMKGIHKEKIGEIAQELKKLRASTPIADQMKMDLANASLQKGKTLVVAKNLNFTYTDVLLWKQPLNFQLQSGDRLALKGLNGSGKTTLIRLLLKEILPSSGTLEISTINVIYIDQGYSLIADILNVYEQAQIFNAGMLQEHEVKVRLNRFLLAKEDWDKPCTALSGGERMRLCLCCLTIANQAPDLIILDEPTNNLDLQNIAILTSAIKEYQGTLLVVSHDEHFLKDVGVKKSLYLNLLATSMYE